MDGIVLEESEFEKEYVLISTEIFPNCSALEESAKSTKATTHENGNKPTPERISLLFSNRNRTGVILTAYCLFVVVLNIIFFSLIIHLLWFHQSPSLRRPQQNHHIHALSNDVNETISPILQHNHYNHALWNDFYDTNSPSAGYMKNTYSPSPLDFGPIGPVFRKDDKTSIPSDSISTVHKQVDVYNGLPDYKQANDAVPVIDAALLITTTTTAPHTVKRTAVNRSRFLRHQSGHRSLVGPDPVKSDRAKSNVPVKSDPAVYSDDQYPIPAIYDPRSDAHLPVKSDRAQSNVQLLSSNRQQLPLPQPHLSTSVPGITNSPTSNLPDVDDVTDRLTYMALAHQLQRAFERGLLDLTAHTQNAQSNPTAPGQTSKHFEPKDPPVKSDHAQSNTPVKSDHAQSNTPVKSDHVPDDDTTNIYQQALARGLIVHEAPPSAPPLHRALWLRWCCAYYRFETCLQRYNREREGKGKGGDSVAQGVGFAGNGILKGAQLVEGVSPLRHRQRRLQVIQHNSSTSTTITSTTQGGDDNYGPMWWVSPAIVVEMVIVVLLEFIVVTRCLSGYMLKWKVLPVPVPVQSVAQGRAIVTNERGVITSTPCISSIANDYCNNNDNGPQTNMAPPLLIFPTPPQQG